MKLMVDWDCTVFGRSEVIVDDGEYAQWCDENDIPEDERANVDNVKEFLACGEVDDWAKHVDLAFDYHTGSEDFKLESVEVSA